MKATRQFGGALAGICAAALLAAAPAHAGPFAGAEPTKDHYGVIFHIDEGGQATIKKTLTNVENLLNDPRLKGKVQVELIANSKGFAVYVKNNGFEKQLKELQDKGVILAQCSNTLHELHVDRKDLYSFVSIVPSGMGEITLREAQGWAYIHPTPPNSSL